MQDFAVKDASGNDLTWQKINKNTWQVDTKGAKTITASYKVYSNELTVRTNELNEVNTAKERVEDISLVTRSISLTRTTNQGRREAIVFTSSIQARLGREQHSQAVPSPGHRLPNGLMAPMTC